MNQWLPKALNKLFKIKTKSNDAIFRRCSRVILIRHATGVAVLEWAVGPHGPNMPTVLTVLIVLAVLTVLTVIRSAVDACRS